MRAMAIDQPTPNVTPLPIWVRVLRWTTPVLMPACRWIDRRVGLPRPAPKVEDMTEFEQTRFYGFARAYSKGWRVRPDEIPVLLLMWQQVRRAEERAVTQGRQRWYSPLPLILGTILAALLILGAVFVIVAFGR